jgi:hypothetical protein
MNLSEKLMKVQSSDSSPYLPKSLIVLTLKAALRFSEKLSEVLHINFQPTQ